MLTIGRKPPFGVRTDDLHSCAADLGADPSDGQWRIVDTSLGACSSTVNKEGAL